MNTPIKKLNHEMINVKPVNYDWSSGYAEVWDFHVANRCEECGEIVYGRGGDKHCDIDSDSECEGYVPESDGPMMSYYYPLPEFAQYGIGAKEAALKLVDLPLVVVEFLETGEWGLALSGGGMDLSWEICEGFMLLGYLPPAHFAGGLPQMAGRGTSTKDRWILAGCRSTLQTVKNCAGYGLRRLRENFKAAK